jgi:hypothetical protein
MGKARSLPSDWSAKRSSTAVGSNLACKYETEVEVKDNGIHSSLLWYGNNYDTKKLYSTGPRGEGDRILNSDIMLLFLFWYPIIALSYHIKSYQSLKWKDIIPKHFFKFAWAGGTNLWYFKLIFIDFLLLYFWATVTPHFLPKLKPLDLTPS